MRTLVVLFLAALGIPHVSAEPSASSLSDAVVAIRRAWATKDERFAELVRKPVPDRFEVVTLVATSAPDDATRVGLLGAMAEVLDGVDAQTGSAALARAWAKATPEAVRAEKRRLDQSEALLDPEEPPDAAAIKKLEAEYASAAPPSVAAISLRLHRVRALVRERRFEDALRLAADLEPALASRDWHSYLALLEEQRALAFRYLRRRTESVAAYRRMADHGRRLGSAAHERQGLRHAIVSLIFMGHTAQRYALGLRLRELADRRAPAGERLGTEIVLLDCEFQLNTFQQAAERAARLLRDAQAANKPVIVRQARNFMLSIATAQGRFREALELAQSIRDDPEFEMDTMQHARDVVAIASLYQDVGRPEEGLALCESALAGVDPDTNLGATAFGTVLTKTASLLRTVGRTAESREHYERAVTLFREIRRINPLLASLGALVSHDLLEGKIEDARKRAEEAVEIARTRGPRQEIRASRLLGRVELAGGRPDVALKAFDNAIALARLGEPRPVIDAYLLAGRGRALRQLGDHGAAQRSLRAATQSLVRVATGLGERHALGLRDQAARVAVDGFRAAIAHSRSSPGDARVSLADAWWFREAGHALLLAETIRNSDVLARERLDAQDRADEESALRALTRAQTTLVTQPDLTDEAEAQFASAHRAYRDVVLRADRGARKPGEWERVTPESLFDFQQALARDAAAIAYVRAGDRLHALCIRRDSVTDRDLASAEKVRKAVTGWRTLASAPGGPTTRLGARLYDVLLRPFESELAGVRSLLVLPDGALSYLPFSALVRKPGDTDEEIEYVIDRMAVSYVPSGAVYGALGRMVKGRAAGRGLIALGDPAYGDTHAALAGTRAEVQAIAALYADDERDLLLGKNATLAGWHDALRRRADEPLRALHLACHGLVDPEQPRLSGLVFAGGEVLNTEQIYRQRIPADLVVLSACETGAGALRRGEGVMGLVRGFFQVGAPRVIVTAWPVSDGPTSTLMSALHTGWKLPDAEAAQSLRHARLAFRKRGDRLAHPFYWAPFVLWGR